MNKKDFFFIIILVVLSTISVFNFKMYGQDFDLPVASSLILSPTYVDVSTGDVTVTLSVRVSDTSGVSVTNTRGAYIHPYANVLNGNKDFTNWSLVNVDEYNGTYETKLFINPSNVPSATYTVVEELWMFDAQGGLSTLSSDYRFYFSLFIYTLRV